MKKIKNACLKLEPTRKVPRKTKDSTRIVLPDGLHVILPDANGDAIGMQDTDTSGVAIAMAGRTAKVVSYGVAYAPDGGSTEAGAGGVAVSHNGNADAGDGAVACTFVGVASAFQWSVAYARQTAAFMQRDGVAVMLSNGLAQVADGGGVACALNFAIKPVAGTGGVPIPTMVTDPAVGSVSGGAGSVVVAFTLDKNKKRRPIVGFIGAKPDCLDGALNLEMELLGYGVQFGLKANVPYRLNAKTNRFEEVPRLKRKKN